MENTQEAKNLIQEAKNIYIIPSENSTEAITSALALFYTLKQQDKNVNILIDKFPDSLMFLLPSIDFISYPKNFVFSIPAEAANISQIYYEKNDDSLKIHLTVDKGVLKKDNISFYYTDIKPDVVITIGIGNYKDQLAEKLDSFGFLLEAPVINIDNDLQNNLKFGKINIVENSPITESALNIAKSISNPSLAKETADCLLAGLMIFSDNFSNLKTSPGILELAGLLMKQGADREKIAKELYPQKPTDDRKAIVQAVLQKLAEQNKEITKENILKYLES